MVIQWKDRSSITQCLKQGHLDLQRHCLISYGGLYYGARILLHPADAVYKSSENISHWEAAKFAVIESGAKKKGG